MKRFAPFRLPLLLLVACAASTQALEPGLPSKTSIFVAALRAVASHDPDPAVRNPDWLAERFLGPRERAAIAGNWAVDALDKDYRDAMKDGRVADVGRMLLIRTRFNDIRLETAIRGGATQVVILGAGFDSRAYRMKELLKDVKVFEVDYGATQEYKRQRVRDVLGAPPANLTYVAIDFTKQKLADVLRKAGYRENRRTFFIWEGVSFYLPEDAVSATLKTIGTIAGAGSTAVFDFMTKEYVLGAPGDPPRATPRGFPQWGEPWISGVPGNKEKEFFADNGLDLVTMISLGTLTDDSRPFLTRKDGTVFGPPQGWNEVWVMRPSGRPAYWDSELAVRLRTQ